MSTKSPQRSRMIRNAALIGLLAGALLGLVPFSINGNLISIPFFGVIGAAIAAATVSLGRTEYD